MDVLVGPTFTIDVSSYGPPSQQDTHGRLYVKQSGGGERSEEASSDSSSSIGTPDDSEDDSKGSHGDGEEVQSKFNGGGGGLGSLGSFGSLEDSLPVKRGLSNYFSGKSKSFASLSEVSSSVSSVKEVEKVDNPFNKRRRILIASKWSRKSSSFYNWPNPKSMPLLALAEDHEEQGENEDEDEDEDEQQKQEHQDQSDLSSSDDKEQERSRTTSKKLLDRRLKSFKSRSCYCLSDLQEH